jgi:hypothetical protein
VDLGLTTGFLVFYYSTNGRVYSTRHRSVMMPEIAESVQNDVDEIGFTAGKVWEFLADNGPVSVTKLTKDLEVSRETVMLAIGWLAREDKISFQQANRGRIVNLK